MPTLIESSVADAAANLGKHPILMASAPYVTVKLAAMLTGLTEKAIRSKIHGGQWFEGVQFRRAPDGGVFIAMKGVAKWIEGRMK